MGKGGKGHLKSELSIINYGLTNNNSMPINLRYRLTPSPLGGISANLIEGDRFIRHSGESRNPGKRKNSE